MIITSLGKQTSSSPYVREKAKSGLLPCTLWLANGSKAAFLHLVSLVPFVVQ